MSRDEDEIVNELVNYTALQMAEGKSRSAVRSSLVAHGVPEEAAAQLVAAVHGGQKRAARLSGAKMLAAGVGLAALGGGITVVTYVVTYCVAVGKTYVVTWGLLVIGVIYALVGLIKMATGANLT